MTLPVDPKERKDVPIYSGVIKYFPDALAAVAELSRKGNDQHNPGKPLHWDRSKSGDELDALLRHVVEAGTLDADGVRHSAKVAWRALANLQKEIEATESRWNEWKGGDCPVRASTMVDVRLRNGSLMPICRAGNLRWSCEGTSGDIIAWRLA